MRKIFMVQSGPSSFGDRGSNNAITPLIGPLALLSRHLELL